MAKGTVLQKDRDMHLLTSKSPSWYCVSAFTTGRFLPPGRPPLHNFNKGTRVGIQNLSPERKKLTHWPVIWEDGEGSWRLSMLSSDLREYCYALRSQEES